MTGWDTRATAGLRAPRAISTSINPTAGVGGHYGGGGPFKRADHSACRAIWRSWQDFHMSPGNSNNYNDIAYNLGCCHHDIVLEGRSTQTRPIVRGGANGNATVNGNRYSVVAIWGSNDGDWPDSLKRAWRYARDWLRQQDRRTGTGLTPHRDMSSTACPGGPGTAWFRAGAPLPSQEDDMPTAEELLATRVQNRVTGKTIELGDLLSFLHEDGHLTNEALTQPIDMPDGRTMSPRTLAKWTYQNAYLARTLIEAQQPLLEAAAKGENLTAEQVAEIAAACAAAASDAAEPTEP